MKQPVKSKNAFIKAVAFAAHKHRDQRRKNADKSPYINNPIALANILANEAGIQDTQILVAAVLHDTLEDTETTVRELEHEFGRKVASIVLEVTDDKSLPKQERKRRQIEHAKHLTKGARLVKLADKISNLRDVLSSPPTKWSPRRRREYIDWAERVVAGMRGTHQGLERLLDRVLRRGLPITDKRH